MSFRVLLFCVLSALSFGQQLPNETAPTTMTKLAVQLQSPDVPEESFASKPKTMYRAGTRYCRVEELPDEEHGIHGLVIINEPDTWLVNLMTKTAKHQIDQGPTFNCRLPIFVFGKEVKSETDMHGGLMDLEFGRELSYFTENGATSQPGPNLRGENTKAYRVESGDSQLLLFTNGTPEKPLAVARQHGSKRDIYWYGTYEEVPFDAKRFAKPEGIKIEEASK